MVLAAPGDRYRRVSADEFVINPASPEDIHELFVDGGWSEAIPLRAVIDCWPLDIPKGEDRLAGGERQADLLGTGTALHLVQALAATSALTSGSLVVATRGGAAVAEAGMSGNLCPRAAGLWGLARVIAIEHPDLGARIVDLDPQDALDDSVALYSESVHGSDARVAYRDRQRWVPRLRRYSGGGGAGRRTGGSRADPARHVRRRGFEAARAGKRLRGGEVRLKILARRSELPRCPARARPLSAIKRYRQLGRNALASS